MITAVSLVIGPDSMLSRGSTPTQRCVPASGPAVEVQRQIGPGLATLVGDLIKPYGANGLEIIHSFTPPPNCVQQKEILCSESTRHLFFHQLQFSWSRVLYVDERGSFLLECEFDILGWQEIVSFI